MAFVIFVPRCYTHNMLIDSDNHLRVAATRRCLFAGHRQRQSAEIPMADRLNWEEELVACGCILQDTDAHVRHVLRELRSRNPPFRTP